MTVTGPEGARSGAHRYSPGYSPSIGPSMARSGMRLRVEVAPAPAIRMHAASGAQAHGVVSRIHDLIGSRSCKVKSLNCDGSEELTLTYFSFAAEGHIGACRGSANMALSVDGNLSGVVQTWGLC